MPVEVDSPPQLHEPNHHTARPKGILKNPSFSGSSGSPTKEDPPSMPLDPQESKEITLQNTIQNAGHRRSSSAARRSSNSRRQSSAAGLANSSADEDPDRMRLKWDEANLYLAEQEAGGRMKITEPKTPFEYGKNAMDEEEEEDDVAIDPRYVNVDEMEMSKKGSTSKKARESEIPGLELGEPEDETAGADLENDRIVRHSSMSRETSKDKHVNVHDQNEEPGMASAEDETKHKLFEEQRKKHYEMRNVKDMLGHPETSDDEDEASGAAQPSLPRRGINGGP